MGDRFFKRETIEGELNFERMSHVDYEHIKEVMRSFHQDHHRLFKSKDYIMERDREAIAKRYEEFFLILSSEASQKNLEEHKDKLEFDVLILRSFIEKYSSFKKHMIEHNQEFVKKKIEDEKEYLDNILKDIDPDIMLDDEQRRAVVIDEDRCLLIAGAGAGKTMTMAAKVKYLVEKMEILPEEILVISFTKKAVGELKERINGRLNIPARISTFHSLGFDIIRNTKYDMPEVHNYPNKIISNTIQKKIYDNKDLMEKLVQFLGFYFDLNEEVFKYDSLNEYHKAKALEDYETLKSGLGDYVRAVGEQREKHSRTLNGEFLRSGQEVQIANFLYLNGLDYEYERPYGHYLEGSKKKYTPDFYIMQGEHAAYLEHYSLSQSWKCGIYSEKDQERYKNSILTKRNLHAKCSTTLLETWSSYDDGRSLMDHLKDVLKEAGFVLKPRDDKEVYDKIVSTGKDKYIYRFVEFMAEFIGLYKTAGHGQEGFDELREKTDNPRSLRFLDIAEAVYMDYQEALKNENRIDFADMINEARALLKKMNEQNDSLPYKYIIIDEFQDIARQRFDLINEMSKVTDAKIVAVGDDWQSIYAFAGSEISLFTKFIELMGRGVELKITNTYRNSQELINVAGKFIQKNSSQKKKNLISNKHLENSVLLYPYDDTQKIITLPELVEDIIRDIENEFGKGSNVLLLGRYNFDSRVLVNSGRFSMDQDNNVKCGRFPDTNITFMTVHRSKGLGFDNVIILNMLEGKYGFPSQVKNDPIMKLVQHEDNDIEFAEERRLFYVALTRTKNRAYIAAPLGKPSRFLVEVIKDNKIEAPNEMNLKVSDSFSLKCARCKFPLKYENNKAYGLPLYVCTNEPELCDFMTNDRNNRFDIKKCPKCDDGYLVVRLNKEDGSIFYGCTNYKEEDVASCKYREQLRYGKRRKRFVKTDVV